MLRDLLIGGVRQTGRGSGFEIVDPSRGEPLATVAAASPDQVRAAVAAAGDAQRGWSRLAQEERSAALHAMAGVLATSRDEIADLLTRETGRPRTRNLVYVDFCVAVFRQYAELGRVLGGRTVPSNDPGQLSLVLRVPYGVVGALIPWNYPLSLLAFKVAPALATGNTVVVKGAPETTLTTLRLVDLWSQHVPPGVLNAVAGGRDVGEAIVSDAGVHLVAFTGSTAAGRAIGAACAQRTKPAHLELGGKDPAIVFEDVDPATAAQGVVWAAFLNAGQVCTSTERAYVHRSVYGEFTNHAVRLAASLRVGDPMDENTQIGPMRSEAGRTRVLGQIAAATDRGAKVLTGGEALAGPGFFLRPTVVTGADHTTSLLTDETFGPVLPIIPFDDDDEAFALAADTSYGLGASIYTRDPSRVRRAYEELTVGNVWVNDPVVDNRGAPFGGMRDSGNARELGLEGLDAFTTHRHVHWNLDLQTKSWWYPYEEE